MDTTTDTTDTTTDAPTIDRRGFLKSSGALLATGAAAGLAGCSGVAGTPEPGSTAAKEQTLRSELQTADVDIRNLKWKEAEPPDEKGFLLWIRSWRTDDVLLEDISHTSHAFAEYVDTVDEPGDALATGIHTPDADGIIGEFYISTAWARGYNAGYLTEEEYADRIIDTIEAV